MIEQHFSALDATEKVLFQQVAANNAYKKILYAEKESIQQQILSFYRLEKETDADFCRRLEFLHLKLEFLQQFIDLNTLSLNTI